jgi:hypothetical protein
MEYNIVPPFFFHWMHPVVLTYIHLFIETVTTQRFNEITFVSSSSTLLYVSAFHEAIIR